MDKAITFDTQAFSSAFNFDMDEDELSRLMSSMLTSSSASYKNNLVNLGYQNKEEPTSISFYFKQTIFEYRWVRKRYHMIFECHNIRKYSSLPKAIMQQCSSICTETYFVW